VADTTECLPVGVENCTVDERINRIAALANIAAYNPEGTREYVDAAPHVKHASLRRLYGEMVVQVFDDAREHSATPRVLDIGAGEGSVTLPFLELGAQVVATDISSSQLAALQLKCRHLENMLEVRCEDMYETFKSQSDKFDIVVMNSFLHHVPDYLGMINEALKLLGPHGQFFTFQDPLRYDSVGKPTLLFSKLAYFSWRIFKGDLIGGLKTRIRRLRGIYLDDSVRDNAEYHVTRNGVDQTAICNLLESQGFDCKIHSYFSTQSTIFQYLGSRLGLKNTFAVVAQKKAL